MEKEDGMFRGPVRRQKAAAARRALANEVGARGRVPGGGGGSDSSVLTLKRVTEEVDGTIASLEEAADDVGDEPSSCSSSRGGFEGEEKTMEKSGQSDGGSIAGKDEARSGKQHQHGNGKPGASGSDRLGRGSTARKGGGRPPSATSEILQFEMRKVPVPPHRMTPLRNSWLELIRPLVEHLKLQVRMNTVRKCVELRAKVSSAFSSTRRLATTTPQSDIPSASSPAAGHSGSSQNAGVMVQRGADYVRAFTLGFEIRDAIALLRLEDLFVESFEVKDVKRLTGPHLSRCIGRLSGKEGKTKHAIENATRTRIVLADSKIHILGSFQNIKLARDSICSLILGTPPGKVYNHLRTVSRRLQERL